jgi:nitrate reductase cytochrome c-type subunit
MKKLFSLLIAAVFALSSGFAVAASHAGAKPMEKKDEMKKDGEKKAAKKAAKKDGDKKAAKKAAKKDADKK